MKQHGSISAILILLLVNFAAHSQWEIQDSGIGVMLQDVCFVDTLHGGAVGDSAIIIVTTDGGENWQSRSSPVDTITLEKVCFLNKNIGYIVGRSGTILSTKDGGTTWVQNESGVNYSLWDLSFVNEDTGWVVGNDLFQTRRRGVILHTSNGGQTWEKQYETYSPSLFTSQLFKTIAFFDEKNGWAFASDYVDNFSLTTVYRTNDGGRHWDIVSQVGTPLFEMSVVSADTIWAGGYTFAKSCNGGLDWELDGSMNTVVRDIAQIDGQNGWLLAGGKILFTDDGGTTWTIKLINEGPSLCAIANAGRNYLWAVGNSGVVMRYQEQTNSVSHEENLLPLEFDLAQNYPNPFNSSTTISFSLQCRKYVILGVYDITGKKIRLLISQPLGPDTYSVIWDGKDNSNRQVPSGIYFYELRADSFSFRKKALLVR